MTYRSLGRTAVQVSPLCLGAMNFGGPTPEADAIRIVNAALVPQRWLQVVCVECEGGNRQRSRV